MEIEPLRERACECPAAERSQGSSSLLRQVDTGVGPPRHASAKKVLALAMTRARAFNHSCVGTEHPRLGLLYEAVGVLNVGGIARQWARHVVLRLPAQSYGAERGTGHVAGEMEEAMGCTAASRSPPVRS
jgi:hypothetical protein